MKKIILFILLNTLAFSSYEIKNEKVYLTGKEFCGDIKIGLYGTCRFEKELLVVDAKSFKQYEERKVRDGIIYDAEDKNNYYYEGEVVKIK